MYYTPQWEILDWANSGPILVTNRLRLDHYWPPILNQWWKWSGMIRSFSGLGLPDLVQELAKTASWCQKIREVLAISTGPIFAIIIYIGKNKFPIWSNVGNSSLEPVLANTWTKSGRPSLGNDVIISDFSHPWANIDCDHWSNRHPITYLIWQFPTITTMQI